MEECRGRAGWGWGLGPPMFHSWILFCISKSVEMFREAFWAAADLLFALFLSATAWGRSGWEGGGRLAARARGIRRGKDLLSAARWRGWTGEELGVLVGRGVGRGRSRAYVSGAWWAGLGRPMFRTS